MSSTAELPRGTVTFLFTDIEGSTRLLQTLGPDQYAEALEQHRRVLRQAWSTNGGHELGTEGDAFFVAFARASDALAAAREAQRAVDGPICVRMGLHTGEPLVTTEGYVGIDVHRAARIAAAGHGGQILVSQSTRELVDAHGFRDLGEHRLKDLTAAERIYQFGGGEFPPLKSLNQTNLPVQPTPVIGRKRELEEVLALLRCNRLLTLTGAGGSGKTRLALQAAAEFVEECPDGVWFVSLAALTDPELVLPTIAQVVGARDDLQGFLRAKKLLLLLDNLEQLLPVVAPQVARLDAQVLATSRERLNVSAEQEYPVPTLPLDDAVALFTQRARQLKPDFAPDEHVTEIARRLDGLPLALELAAARVKVLKPRQIVDRLGRSLDLLTVGARDAPVRQRTLRATIEWSYELLSNEEKQLFGRLAVFPGSFELEAAEAVCDAELDGLQALVDKSFLRQTADSRFFMLETIRAFGVEQLIKRGESDTFRGRHLDFFLRVSERANASVEVHEQASLLDQMDDERENIRAAFGSAIDLRRFEDLARAVCAFGRLWTVRGPHHEGRMWFELALEHTTEDEAYLRARLKSRLGELAIVRGDWAECARLADEALRVYRLCGDAEWAANSLIMLSEASLGRGDLASAKPFAEEAASAARAIGAGRMETVASSMLGNIALYERDYDRARHLFDWTVERFRVRQQEADLALDLGNLALVEVLAGRVDRAAALAKEALPLLLRIGDVTAIAHGLEMAAAVLLKRGQFGAATVMLGAGKAFRIEHGVQLQPIERALNEETTAAARAEIGEDAYRHQMARGRSMALDAVLPEVLAALDSVA